MGRTARGRGIIRGSSSTNSESAWAYGAVAKTQRTESGTSASRWKCGSIDIGGSANISDWQHRLKECGIILDFKPDIADAVVAGDLALDAAYQQADSIRTSAEWDKITAPIRAISGMSGCGSARNVGAEGQAGASPPT